MGAVAITNRTQGAAGTASSRGKVVEADVTFSASYATGGDTVAVSALGLNGIREILIPSHNLRTRKDVADASSQAGKTIQLSGTETARTLKVYDTAATEVAAATNLSAVVIRVRFIGY